MNGTKVVLIELNFLEVCVTQFSESKTMKRKNGWIDKALFAIEMGNCVRHCCAVGAFRIATNPIQCSVYLYFVFVEHSIVR